MDEAERAAVERVLRDRAEALGVRIAGMAAPPERGSGISFGKRVGDGTTEAVRSPDRRRCRHLAGVLPRARSSRLQKLDDGTYGTCDAYGGPIAAARLRFSPEAVLCIDCARAAR